MQKRSREHQVYLLSGKDTMRRCWRLALLMLIVFLAFPTSGFSFQKAEQLASNPAQTFLRIGERWTNAKRRSADPEANRVASLELTELCSLSDGEVLSVAKDLNRAMQKGSIGNYAVLLAFQVYLLLIYDTSAVPKDQLSKYLFLIYVINDPNKDVPDLSRANPWELKGHKWSLKPVTYSRPGGSSVDFEEMADRMKILPRRRFIGFWQRQSDSATSPSVLLYTSNNASYSKLLKIQTLVAKHCRRWSFDVNEISTGKYQLSVYVDRKTFNDAKTLVSNL